ncbi:hypothetical protein L1987_24868 [Smallanthus sonchifolius]|uniref:Uncharacterized protein n=1 Tax=Smallanthus sonchifolius TaxID=185202 RepID=A0ACB9ILN5_9ASTR|nr:hypothetical protein L1987_24868 [Smallanthus sonchifolius]
MERYEILSTVTIILGELLGSAFTHFTLNFLFLSAHSLRKFEIRDCPFGDKALLANVSQAVRFGLDLQAEVSAAGSINLNGALTVEVQRSGGETFMGNIVRLVDETQSREAPVQRLDGKVLLGTLHMV